jgi:protein required for attachment to host cells
MDKVWIVVADSAVARIFTAATPTGALEELETLDHPEGRMREQELVSDLPGRTFDRAGEGRHMKEVQVRPKEHEATKFAENLAQHLETGRVQGRYDTLFLVAAPDFLGLVRQKLSPQTAALVQLEIDNDFTKHDPREIRKALPDRLFSTL